MIFKRGSKWKHRRQTLVVRITGVHTDGKLSLVVEDQETPTDDFFKQLFRQQTWTTSDLVKEFLPIAPALKWDLLYEDPFASRLLVGHDGRPHSEDH